jgi:hypothetical protein
VLKKRASEAVRRAVDYNDLIQQTKQQFIQQLDEDDQLDVINVTLESVKGRAHLLRLVERMDKA